MTVHLQAIRPIAVLWVLSLIWPALVVAAELTVAEQAIAARVDEAFEDQVTFLEKTVNINSETTNLEGVEAVGAIFVTELKALGFDARLEPMRDKTRRAGHVVATRKGTSGLRILAIGHLDTVHLPTSSFTTFERDGDRATGPGIIDMKSGNAILLYALKALAAEDALKSAGLTVILTGDEEMPGENVLLSRAGMIEAARKSDVVLSFENGEPGFAVTSRRGFASWVLDVEGARAHSSQIFSEQVGAGAIFGLANLLSRFYGEVRGEPLLTFNAAVSGGGTSLDYDPDTSKITATGKSNIVPQTAMAAGEIRFLDQAQLDRTRTRMEAVVAQSLEGTKASIVIREGYPAMPDSPGNQRLLSLLSEINVSLGNGSIAANDPLTRGAGDISFVGPITGTALDGLGGAGGGAHTEEEWLDLKDFRDATKRAAILLHRLTQKNARALLQSPN